MIDLRYNMFWNWIRWNCLDLYNNSIDEDLFFRQWLFLHSKVRYSYKRKLLNLLAVIHRDGGHYTEKYGVEKSVNDAIQIVADAIVMD